VAIFDKLRRARAWWLAPLVSSTVASAVDSMLFVSLAFLGEPVPWVTWGIGDFVVKASRQPRPRLPRLSPDDAPRPHPPLRRTAQVSLALVCLLPFRALTRGAPIPAAAAAAAVRRAAAPPRAPRAAGPAAAARAALCSARDALGLGSAPPRAPLRPFEPLPQWQRVEPDHVLPPGAPPPLAPLAGGGTLGLSKTSV
jgi:hypothetical protein